ncbi:hypothetical protein JW711_05880 [Candidatus Woesearchaeota archaeon]|nr:hypothetical protein [Candidatus Woesearchaeota archaeon]
MRDQKVLEISAMILLVASILSAMLLVSGCTGRAYQYSQSVPQLCGDGLCTREERTTCDLDCGARTPITDEEVLGQDWISQVQEERKQTANQAPVGQRDYEVEKENYEPVTPDPGISVLHYDSFEQPLPEVGFFVASRYNLLSIGEKISEVMGVLTAAHLREVLKGGLLRSNTEAFGPQSAFYQQRIQLRSGRVVFGYDEESRVISTYLEYLEGEPIIDYLLVMDCGILKFFEGQIINFLGQEYVLSDVSNSTLTMTGVTTQDVIMFRNSKSTIINGEEISTYVLNVTFSHEYLRIILNAPDDIRILPAQSLTDFVKRRLLMTNRIDITYEGLSEVDSVDVHFRKVGDYTRLDFQNNLGQEYTIPLVEREPFFVGSDDNEFVFKEGSGWNDYIIGEKDWFIINNRREEGGITTILQLTDVSPENGLLKFKDPNLDEVFNIYFEGTPGFQNATGDLLVYGVNHKVYVGPNKTLSIDLDGDGQISHDSVPIISKGNTIIRLAAEDDNLTATFTTPAKLRENSNQDLKTTIILDNDGIIVPEESLLMERDSKEERWVGLTDYGTLLVLEKDTEKKEQRGYDLLINQPLSQRLANVIFRAYE